MTQTPQTIPAREGEITNMRKFSIPSFPISGNFGDQESFAASVRQEIRRMVNSAGDSTHIGIVTGGMGGGYAHNLDESWGLHPIETIVFLVKPKKDYATMAEVVTDLWAYTTPEECNQDSEIEDFDCREIPVGYFFDTQANAENFVAELEATQ